MKIGIAAENRPKERRVIMLPHEIKRVAAKREVIVEKGAGLGISIKDKDYIKVGCKIGSREEVYGCDLVVRIKEPRIDEIEMMRPGAAIMSMMHIRCRPDLEKALRKQGLIVIPLENLKDPVGRRKVEAVADSGRIGMEYGFKLWGKDPATATVKIMGYGNIAVGAIRCAARKFARVVILNKKHFQEMEKHIPGTDILVDAINRPYRRDVEEEPYFVTRAMLKLFKPGSAIVDLVSNPIKHAPVETMHPTYLSDMYYEVDGIYHASCWGWPGMEPVRISERYSLQLAPILRDLANKGLEECSSQTRAVILYPGNDWLGNMSVPPVKKRSK